MPFCKMVYLVCFPGVQNLTLVGILFPISTKSIIKPSLPKKANLVIMYLGNKSDALKNKTKKSFDLSGISIHLSFYCCPLRQGLTVSSWLSWNLLSIRLVLNAQRTTASASLTVDLKADAFWFNEEGEVADRDR